MEEGVKNVFEILEYRFSNPSFLKGALIRAPIVVFISQPNKKEKEKEKEIENENENENEIEWIIL